MQRVEQPNRWSCLPAAFATVLELDFGTITTLIGHDGSDILYPELKEPFNHRGFHIQELIRVAWQLGYSVTQFQVLPQMQHGEHYRQLYHWTDGQKQMSVLLAQANAVITGLNDAGNHHAIAWDCAKGRMLDPARHVCNVNSFRVESVWMLQRFAASNL